MKSKLFSSLKFLIISILIVCITTAYIPCVSAFTIFPMLIKNIEIEDIQLIENEDGYYDYDYDDNYDPCSDEYFRYYYSVTNYKVTLINDTVLTSDEDGAIEYNNNYYYLDYTDDQSYDNQWKLGTHKVEADLQGYKTNFNVNIVESPVLSVDIKDVSFYEYTNGYYEYDYNEDTDDYDLEYYCYDLTYYPFEYKVTLKDGTVLESDADGDIYYNNKFYYVNCSDDQSYNNQWGQGNHNITVTILGYSTNINVTIKESALQSLVVDDVNIIEGTNLYEDYYFDDDLEDYVYWYAYDIGNLQFTATFKDGTVVTGDSLSGIDYEGVHYDLYYDDYQDYYNQWGVGTHQINVDILGFKTTANINILETPVKSLTISDVELIENAGGIYIQDYDLNDDTFSSKWFCYLYDIPSFKVIMKDGTILRSDKFGSVHYKGNDYTLDIYDEQDYYNQWQKGVHTVEASFLGKKSTYNVNIVESPVTSVSINDIYRVENTGYWKYDTKKVYYNYYYDINEFSVTLNDGTVLNSENGAIKYKDYSYDVDDIVDKQSTKMWLKGAHSVTASVMGCKTTFNVNIIASPVKSLKLSDVNLIKDVDCYPVGIYDDDNEMVSSWMRYEYPNPEYELTLDDGTVITNENNPHPTYIEYKGQAYAMSVSDDQAEDNVWTLGTHTAEASLLGVNTSFNVNINEAQVKPDKIYGDVNYDGYASIIDVTEIQKNIVGLTTFTEEQALIADVNQDNDVNIMDVTSIQKYVADLSDYGVTGNKFN